VRTLRSVKPTLRVKSFAGHVVGGRGGLVGHSLGSAAPTGCRALLALAPHRGLRARRAGLRSEAEVGARSHTVPVDDDPCHLAAAEAE